jgi:hypothetical protein
MYRPKLNERIVASRYLKSLDLRKNIYRGEVKKEQSGSI